MPRVPIALAALVALAGCLGDAPHENPLDPLSDRYRDEGAVTGRVLKTSSLDPRPDVRVRLVPAGGGVEYSAMTGPDGAFRIEGVRSGTYLVRTEGEGLESVDTEVEVEVGGTAQLELRVDALPRVEAQAARTVRIDQFFPRPLIFRLEVEATATDPDLPSGIASVELVAEDLGFRAPLASLGGNRYGATFEDDALPGGRVQSLLGRPLRIEATDVSGNVGAGPPLALVRVIEQTPLTASPQGDTLATARPTLEWRPAGVAFDFTYRVDVNVVVAGIPTLVETVSGLPETTTSYTLAEPLPPGDYVWWMWVVDEAGDRSRSKEASFFIPDGL